MLRHAAAAGAARLLVLGTLTWAAAGCAATVSTRPRPEPVVYEDHREDHHEDRRKGHREDDREERREHRRHHREERHAALGIPRGHLPPPGKCRVWFPGRPPGHQPKPVSCRKAMAYAPAGSWVLYRPRRGEEVHARVIDSRRPGVIVSIQVYGSAEGRYLRTERP